MAFLLKLDAIDAVLHYGEYIDASSKESV